MFSYQISENKKDNSSLTYYSVFSIVVSSRWILFPVQQKFAGYFDVEIIKILIPIFVIVYYRCDGILNIAVHTYYLLTFVYLCIGINLFRFWKLQWTLLLCTPYKGSSLVPLGAFSGPKYLAEDGQHASIFYTLFSYLDCYFTIYWKSWLFCLIQM